jgi:hypothetical protein
MEGMLVAGSFMDAGQNDERVAKTIMFIVRSKIFLVVLTYSPMPPIPDTSHGHTISCFHSISFLFLVGLLLSNSDLPPLSISIWVLPLWVYIRWTLVFAIALYHFIKKKTDDSHPTCTVNSSSRRIRIRSEQRWRECNLDANQESVWDWRAIVLRAEGFVALASRTRRMLDVWPLRMAMTRMRLHMRPPMHIA